MLFVSVAGVEGYLFDATLNGINAGLAVVTAPARENMALVEVDVLIHEAAERGLVELPEETLDALEDAISTFTAPRPDAELLIHRLALAYDLGPRELDVGWLREAVWGASRRASRSPVLPLARPYVRKVWGELREHYFSLLPR